MKKMNKLGLLLWLMLSAQFAYSQQNILITAGNASGCTGDTIAVPITTTGGSGVAAISLALDYDVQGLTFAGFANPSAQIGPGLLVNAIGGKVLASWFSTSAINLTQGTLFNVLFVVNNGSALQWDLQTPGNCELADFNGNPINTGFTNGGVSFSGASILNQPSGNVNLVVGDATVLRVAASNATGYQWQFLNGTSWVNVMNDAVHAGATTDSLSFTNVPAGFNGRQYRVQISSTCVAALLSNTITLAVNLGPPPPIEVYLTAGSVCVGDTLDVVVKVDNLQQTSAISLVLAYPPQALNFVGFRQANTALGSNLVINDNGNQVLLAWFNVQPLNLPAQSSLVTYRFVVNAAATLNWDLQTPGNCEFADDNGVILPATFTGEQIQVSLLPVINQNPTNLVVANGDTAIFTVSAANVVNYQWQRLLNGSWVDLTAGGIYAGTTTSTMSVIASPAISGATYRVKIQGSCPGFVFSQSASLTVAASQQNILITAGNASGCTGDTIAVPITTTGGSGVAAISLALGYDVQGLTFAGFANPSAQIGPGLLVNAIGGKVLASWFSTSAINLTQGTLFNVLFVVNNGSALQWDLQTPGNCELADFNGNPINTGFTNGGVSFSGASILNQPSGNVNLVVGDATVLRVAASNATGYQWQFLNGTSWVNVMNDAVHAGATTDSLSFTNVPAGFNGRQYRVQISSTCVAALLSNTITLAVNLGPPPPIEVYLTAGSVCVGDTLDVVVKVDNLQQTSAISLVLAYPPQALNFVGFRQANTALGSNLVINDNGNQVLLAWFNVQPLNLPAQSSLVTYRFVVNAAATLNWDLQTPGNCEFADDNGVILPATFTGEQIQVSLLPVINQNPTNLVVANGDTAIFTVSAANVVNYQWQRLLNGSWVDLTAGGIYAGTTTSTMSVIASPAISGATYRVKIQGSCPGFVFSQSASLTVAASNVVVNVSVGNFTACVGQTISVPVQVNNFIDIAAFSLTLAYDTAKLLYTGFVANNAVQNGLIVNSFGTEMRASWFNLNPATIGSGTLLTLQFTTKALGQAPLIWNTNLQGANEFADFNGIALLSTFTNGSINVSGAAPQITQEPLATQALEGDTTGFSVIATNANSFQWQELNGSNWVNLANQAPFTGVNTASLQIANVPLSFSGKQYRVVIGGNCPPVVNSLAATLTVTPNVNAIVLSLPNLTTCAGSSITVPIAVENFNNVATFSLRILYNQSNLVFTGVSGVVPQLQATLASGASNGRVNLSWFGINPVNLGSATILNLNFTVNGSSTLVWDTVSAGSGQIGNLAGNQYVRILVGGAITANPVPTINFPTLGNICLNQASLSLQATPAGGVFSGTGVSQGAFSPTTAGVGTHIITYAYTDSLGCSNTTTRSITVLPIPNGNAGADQTICLGGTATLLASGGSTYLWSTGATTASISVTPLVTTTYTVQITNAAGCSISDTVVVNIFSDPNMSAGADVSICAGGNVQLQASGATQYFWTPSTGLSANNIANPLAAPQQTTSYVVAGLTASGCVSLDTVVVTVNPRPTIDAGPNAIACNGSAVQLNATGGVSYSWAPAAGLSAANIANPMANPTNTTQYIVTGTNANGCTNRDTIIVFVPRVNAGNNQTICRGGSVQLQAGITGNAGSGVTYSWSPATGLSNNNIANPVASPIITTSYTVTASTAGGCAVTSTVAVIVNPTPTIDAGINVSIAPGASVSLNASAAGGLQPYTISWSPAAGLSSTSNLTPVATPAATTMYYLSVTGTNGCVVTDSVLVTLDPNLLGKNIQGKLVYDNALFSPIGAGSVVLNDSLGVLISSVNVDAAANYLFQNLNNAPYILQATTTRAWGGVTSADALLINGYFADPTLFSGLKVKAADVNNDGVINANDALQTLQRSVNSISSFAAGDWAYSNDTVIVAGQNVQRNVRAVCVGDVNGSYSAGLRILPRVLLSEGIRTGKPAFGSVQVPLYLEEALDLGSLQLELELKPGDVLESVQLPGSNFQPIFKQHGQMVKIGWFSTRDALALNAGDLLMTFNIKTTGFGVSGSPFEIVGQSEFTDLKAEVYSMVRVRTPIWTSSAIANELELRNYPNPARYFSHISYVIPAAGQVKLVLTDVTGRVLDTPVNASQQAGRYEYELDASQLAAGMYFIRLELYSEGTIRTTQQKMMIQK